MINTSFREQYKINWLWISLLASDTFTDNQNSYNLCCGLFAFHKHATLLNLNVRVLNNLRVEMLLIITTLTIFKCFLFCNNLCVLQMEVWRFGAWYIQGLLL